MRAPKIPLICLAIYSVFVISGGLVSHLEFSLPPLRQLSSAAGALTYGLSALEFAILRGAEYAPCGALLGWLVSASRPDARAGGARTSVGAVLLALALYTAQSRATPTLLGATLPMFAALFGWLCASAYFSQAGARRIRVACALTLVLLPLLLLASLPLLALSRSASLGPLARIETEQRRSLMGKLRGRDPRKIPVGETRTVTLSARDVDALVRWLADAGLRARASVALEDQGFGVRLALPVPRTSRWLNVSARSVIRFRAGRFHVADAHLTLGAVTLPSWLVTRVVGDALAEIQRNPDLGTILGAVTNLAVAPEQASVTYGHLEAERGLLSRLVWGEDADREIREGVTGYVQTLLDALIAAPPGDVRFEAALTALFVQARIRSETAPAVDENRNALIALGLVLGHRSLARLVGVRLDDAARARIDALRDATTIHRRGDWTRHFSVSAALMVLSDVAPSDAVGVLKEELDADGGSGFSFADLLADRAGTRFAERATRDEVQAKTVQLELRSGFHSDGYVPSADGLPEGLPEAEFKAKFGGVGAAPYRALADDIEKRIAALPVYSGS